MPDQTFFMQSQAKGLLSLPFLNAYMKEEEAFNETLAMFLKSKVS